MVTLDELLAGVSGVKDIPTATRKAIQAFTLTFKQHGHPDVFRGTVREERNVARSFKTLLQDYRNGKITKDLAIKRASQVLEAHNKRLYAIALRRAKRVLGKQIKDVNPEVSERIERRTAEALKHLENVLDDVGK